MVLPASRVGRRCENAGLTPVQDWVVTDKAGRELTCHSKECFVRSRLRVFLDVSLVLAICGSLAEFAMRLPSTGTIGSANQIIYSRSLTHVRVSRPH